MERFQQVLSPRKCACVRAHEGPAPFSETRVSEAAMAEIRACSLRPGAASGGLPSSVKATRQGQAIAPGRSRPLIGAVLAGSLNGRDPTHILFQVLFCTF